ncbi:hypothetical protein CH333_09345 [candidate division WOR-3 bacterium JGI_Cruoil_03_44_89]|uniref:TldD/PmbA family protein n=1 Tax=candidate division WOR-3 bacterium JGI_Cruoil_03_44_89 TaxID=1973748 RepID=A0A235BP58_UNCW3|nr:MAG: hypothetical protein CH333_09345 [candidate division WOR-3 bacterium JGI_Cruoil_03_44_89]
MLDICEFALSRAKLLGADEVEIYAESNRTIRITIQNNSIDLARSDVNEGIGIRAFKRCGLGYASCNSLLEKDVVIAVDGATSLASAAPRDPGNYLPAPKKVEKLNIFDPGSETFSIENGIEFAVRLLESARKDERVSIESGGFNAVIKKRAIVTSKCTEEKESSNYFVYYLMGMAREGDIVSSFDVEFDATRWLKEIDVEKIGGSLADKVLASLGAEKGESFKGSILLSPDAVNSLVIRPLIFALNANNMQKGMSRFTGKLGSSVASGIFTLIDDGTLEGGIGTEGFDREGMPHSRLSLIENGILSSFMYNAYTANRERRDTTGHARGGTRGVPGIGPTNMIIPPGDKAKDDIIGEIKKGVVVTRFSGFPNPISGDFSGVVKGGFLVENGRVTKPLLGTLISGNVYKGLKNVSAISKETKKLANLVLPYIRIENVSVTSR